MILDYISQILDIKDIQSIVVPSIHPNSSLLAGFWVQYNMSKLAYYLMTINCDIKNSDVLTEQHALNILDVKNLGDIMTLNI